jgi:hypothetical protein
VVVPFFLLPIVAFTEPEIYEALEQRGTPEQWIKEGTRPVEWRVKALDPDIPAPHRRSVIPEASAAPPGEPRWAAG